MSLSLNSLPRARRLISKAASTPSSPARETLKSSRRKYSIPRSLHTLKSSRAYTTIHPAHKEPVRVPTKDEEDADKAKRASRSVNIIGLTRQELEEEFTHFNLPKYRATQVFQWLYGQGATKFENMPNLGKNLISQLNELYFIDYGSTTADSTSNDGTRKWLVDLGGKQCVESA